jgi:hypothetical protein
MDNARCAYSDKVEATGICPLPVGTAVVQAVPAGIQEVEVAFNSVSKRTAQLQIVPKVHGTGSLRNDGHSAGQDILCLARNTGVHCQVPNWP